MKLTKDQAALIEWRKLSKPSSQVTRAAWIGPEQEELFPLLPEGFVNPLSPHGDLGRVAGALLVEFTSGGVYVYENVSEAQTDDLLVMESVGRGLNQRIKPGRKYEKVVIDG